jgi:hypothetical protein
MPRRTKSITDKKNRSGSDEQFPLEAYIAVYKWIGDWAEVASEPGERVIAQAAYESLTAVGVLMRDVMRQMRSEIDGEPSSNKPH